MSQVGFQHVGLKNTIYVFLPIISTHVDTTQYINLLVPRVCKYAAYQGVGFNTRGYIFAYLNLKKPVLRTQLLAPNRKLPFFGFDRFDWGVNIILWKMYMFNCVNMY